MNSIEFREHFVKRYGPGSARGWQTVFWDDAFFTALAKLKVLRPLVGWRQIGRSGLSPWALKGLTGLSSEAIEAQLRDAIKSFEVCYLNYCDTTHLPIYVCAPLYHVKAVKELLGNYAYEYYLKPGLGVRYASGIDRENDLMEKLKPLDEFTEEECRLFDPENVGCTIYPDVWNWLKDLTNDPRWDNVG